MNTARVPAILVVEDDSDVGFVLQAVLGTLGYDAFAVAATAEEALACAEARRPDLVLMDVRIRGARDGIETAELLRDRYATPVVFLTARTDDESLERAKRTGPYGYLVKPAKPAELRSAIDIALHRHQLEKDLRERERWFSTTLHSIADAVVTVGLDDRITFMNGAAERLTGTAAATALGQPVVEVVRIGRLGEGGVGEIVNVSTGARRVIDEGTAPVLDGGRPLGTVTVLRDITEAWSLKKQLERADRLTSMGAMAAGVAHEVNNPLAVVVGNAALVAEELARHADELRAEGRPAERLDGIAQSLADLRVASERIAQIVADLNAFSRPAPPERKRVDVRTPIEWAIRATSHELRNRASLTTSFGEVPPVMADESRLSQVFVNLLVNAAFAIPPGSADRHRVVVSTRLDAEGVVIEVSDTGDGMSDEIRARIFDPFFTTKDVGAGSGLGLSICHGIVTSFGGRIEVVSAVGEGTTFRLIIPPAEVEAPRPSVTAPAPVTRGRRILAIDDEEMVLRTLVRIFRDHEVVATERARDALALLDRGEVFDVVLCDVMMPTMTGIELYDELLARHPEVAKRVVFLSGGATTAKVQDFLASMPRRRVDKPFQIQRLREVVARMLAGDEPFDRA